MNLFRISLLPFVLITTNSYVIHNQIERKFSLRTFEAYDSLSAFGSMKKKLTGMVKLVRPNNILPVMLLNFTGGWLANPSLANLMRSKGFFASIAITVLVTMYSMIMNDLFDVKLDRINNPTRPLVTGQVTKIEALITSFLMLSAAEFLNSRYIPPTIRHIPRLAVYMVSLYTPVLKRIVYIKNLTCAGLISFSIYFTGLVVHNTFSYNDALFNIATQFIFWGSLQNEILLDICDKEGDEKNGVATIPVRYGREVAFTTANFIAHYNILWNLYYLMSKAYGSRHGFLLMFFCLPLLRGLYKIKNDYNIAEIKRISRSTTKPMFLVLIYLCFMRSCAK
jgi:geranylgeranylglycerol-phosphate geranylgeranyltransferase